MTGCLFSCVPGVKRQHNLSLRICPGERDCEIKQELGVWNMYFSGQKLVMTVKGFVVGGWLRDQWRMAIILDPFYFNLNCIGRRRSEFQGNMEITAMLSSKAIEVDSDLLRLWGPPQLGIQPCLAAAGDRGGETPTQPRYVKAPLNLRDKHIL